MGLSIELDSNQSYHRLRNRRFYRATYQRKFFIWVEINIVKVVNTE